MWYGRVGWVMLLSLVVGCFRWVVGVLGSWVVGGLVLGRLIRSVYGVLWYVLGC